MLEEPCVRRLMDDTWEQLDCQVQIPTEWEEDYFDATGPVPANMDDRRRFRRYFCRDRAILEIDGQQHAVYLKDLSRSGLAFLHARQLLPLSVVQMWLPNGSQPHMIIRRCRRLGPGCYECGAEFGGAE